MTFGKLLILVLFALNIISFGLYLLSIGSGRGWLSAGRAAQWLKAALSGLAVFYLGTLFVQDQFGFRYVYENSTRAQQLIYKIAGIWAGQEGTFLLWLFLLSAVGLAMAYSLKEYESWGMIFASVFELTLCALLLHRSPFASMSGMPQDGLGMNPLLRNPWMAIHPPIVFLGYALAAAPFAVFMAGVCRKEYFEWTRRAWPWVVLSWAVLGLGIFLGSYWAYEVLGWGGYWGWDPVENASLFPWIALGGLVHGLILQAYRRGFALWNGLMAAAAYFLVLYSTFLTRSGVLGDFSVHSFQGLELYVPLLLTLALTGALGILGILMFALQAVRLPKQDAGTGEKADARPLLLRWAILLFWIFFGFVFIGTNLPIIAKSQVRAGYYNVTSLAVGVPFAALLFVCPLFFRRRAGGRFSWALFGAGLAAGVFVFGVVCLALGIKNPAALLFAVAGGAGLVTHGKALASVLFSGKTGKAGKGNYQAYIAHIGVALIFVGFITSSAGTKSGRFALAPGEKAELSGYGFSVAKIKPNEFGWSADIHVSGKRELEARIVYVAESEQRAAVNKPFISRTALGDLYITPVQIVSLGKDGEEAASGRQADLKQGETKEIEGVKVTFEKYDLARMRSEGVVGVALRAEYDGGEETIVPTIGQGPDGVVNVEAKLEGRDLVFYVVSISPGDKTVTLAWKKGGEKKKSAGRELAAIFNVSLKPLIGLVWLGVILICAGSLLAALRRFFILKQKNL